ncbi:MAG: DUF4129 domain-containing protein [Pseudomonadota bacterium]|nr:DUF4129 domain-containing protein [Pseudomonadota bacterium]
MQLNRLNTNIRPRTSWEGVDLGFALGRRWFPTLCGLWWLTALPLGAVSALWLRERPDLWILLLWWLKPLYEAPLLLWLSRALFGDSLGLRALWRQRHHAARLLPNLLWRRFSLSRSFQMPVILLEGLGGRARRERQQTLAGNNTAGWLTVICIHLESILWACALLLVVFLVPEELPRMNLNDAVFDVGSWPYWGSAILYWLAMSIIAPFYVGAGFALYLTRRTELEAWDLELAFRRAGEGSRPPRPGRAAGSLLLLVPALCLSPATEATTEKPSRVQAQALISEVLEGEDFGTKREAKVWVYIGEGKHAEEGPEPPEWLQQLLLSLANGATPAAQVLKWTLILLATALAVLALRRIVADLRNRRTLPSLTQKTGPATKRLTVQTPATLPQDVPEAVRDLLARGEARAALALLYRASLTHLLERYGLEMPAGATESEYLALVQRCRPPEETALLLRLTQAWQRLAYGHRAPSAEQIAALLHEWQAWEGGTGGV